MQINCCPGIDKIIYAQIKLISYRFEYYTEVESFDDLSVWGDKTVIDGKREMLSKLLLQLSDTQGRKQRLKLPTLVFSEETQEYKLDQNLPKFPERKESDNSNIRQSYLEYIQNITKTQKDLTLIRKFDVSPTDLHVSIKPVLSEDPPKSEKMKQSTSPYERASSMKTKDQSQSNERFTKISNHLQEYRHASGEFRGNSFLLADFEKYLHEAFKIDSFTQIELYSVIGKLAVENKVMVDDGTIFFIQ